MTGVGTARGEGARKGMARAAVIGAGSRAPAHIEAYRHVDAAAVVAVCDRSGTGSARLAERYGIQAYQDVRRMLRIERPDLVHIVTGPIGRIDLMEIVAAEGVPLCTVEKPVAAAVSDLRRLERLEAAATTRFAVSHQFRWHPDFAAVRDAVAAGAIGSPDFVDMSAGMTVTGQGTHILHYGMELAGASPVLDVLGAAEGWSEDDPDHPGPASAQAVLRFANGARGLWVTGRLAPRVGDRATVWQHVRVAVYGDGGQAWWEEFGSFGAPGLGRSSFGGTERWRELNLVAQAGFHRAMLDWLENIDRPPSTHLGRALHEWRVVLAFYQSVLNRKRVDVVTFVPPDELISEVRAALQA